MVRKGKVRGGFKDEFGIRKRHREAVVQRG